jgi:anti-sigma regulatory factor (Ser/Thr protein kinase)
VDSTERERLAALRRYRILDTDPEEAFDDLALLASRICGTPMALISLVDAERQWFKARVGVTVRETSRSVAFCAHAIQQGDLFLVPDALLDERFRDNPLVREEPHIRFYAGAPLVTPDGHALGTLCVVDRAPRQLERDQEEALAVLKRQAEAQLELRLNLMELKQALSERDRAEDERERLIGELRESLDNVRKLSGLLPVCSACHLDMVIPANVGAISGVCDGVLQVLREMGRADGEELAIETALREALANAIKHGCRNDANMKVQCCVACEESGEIVIVVRDPGPGFRPSEVPSPVDAPGLLKDHGRGIHLINEFMDEVRFEQDGREIQMRKRSRRPPPPEA